MQKFDSRIAFSCWLMLGAILIGLAMPGTAAAATPDAPWTLQSSIGAPENFNLSGTFRGRYETLTGQPRVGLDASPDLFTLRTTLLAEYRKGWLRIGGELNDARAYPKEPGSGVSTSEVNALEPLQAYAIADFGSLLKQGSAGTLQAGRFVLNLGSRRLVAADDYRNATSAVSGVRLDMRSPVGNSAALIYALPQRHLPDDLPSILDNDIGLDHEGADLVLWGGIATLPKLMPDAALELYRFELAEKDSAGLATRNRNLHSTGFRVFRDPVAARMDFEIESVYQSGSVRASTSPAATELDVSAYFYHLETGYQWADGWKPRLALEYDYASGDDAGADYGRFDTLFGLRRGDFGPSGIYSAISRANISSPGLRLEGTPTRRLDLMVSYRALWLASRTDSFTTTGVRDPSGHSGDFAGHQLDTRVRYWLVPQVWRLEADALLLLKGRFMEDAPNAPATGDTRYLSLNLSANF